MIARAIESDRGLARFPAGEGHPAVAETLLVSGSQPYWAFRRFRFLARGFDARGEVGGKFSNGWFLKDNRKGLNRFSDWEFNLPRGTGNISRVIDIFCKEKPWSRIFNISFFSCFVYNPIISNILWYVK